MPQWFQDVLDRTASVSSRFAPFGTYCLLLNDVVRVIDSRASPQLLHLTIAQLFSGVKQIGQTEHGSSFVLRRFLSDHGIANYKGMLRNAISSMVPLLFMGGHVSDYQPLLVQRQTANGMS